MSEQTTTVTSHPGAVSVVVGQLSRRQARAARRAQLIDNAEVIRKAIAVGLGELDALDSIDREEHRLIVGLASQLAVLGSVLEQAAEA
ncbi:hypothetical protein [Rhodococcus sp. 14-2470-1a]|uniref:hypothetical protein n=1 Tax=Rhodococcus sp. 14-2470-1a TaxID=2023150 RepID=UPI000B9BE269|nr:hypothetical protein [Rhodococcus sp. 14-2470-1a]OZF47534.1 hypothetical protein CH292_19100 [Rhodococcus sp. 14-2470-1a]